MVFCFVAPNSIQTAVTCPHHELLIVNTSVILSSGRAEEVRQESIPDAIKSPGQSLNYILK